MKLFFSTLIAICLFSNQYSGQGKNDGHPSPPGEGKGMRKTYCNPLNLDYGYTPIPNFSTWGRHRATADPVVVTYKGDYYLFSTNQWGYWHSPDMLNWTFNSRKFFAHGMKAMMNFAPLQLALLAIP
jgi:hypothetical protein